MTDAGLPSIPPQQKGGTPWADALEMPPRETGAGLSPVQIKPETQ